MFVENADHYYTKAPISVAPDVGHLLKWLMRLCRVENLWSLRGMQAERAGVLDERPKGRGVVSARRTHLQNPSIKGDGVRVFLADTIALISRIFMRQRSSYPKSFKAQVVQECLQPGATISSGAIHHGINANVIRKWLPTYRDRLPATLPAFVLVKTPPRRAIEEMAIISLSLGDKSITVKWPSSDPDGCARFISGLAQ